MPEAGGANIEVAHHLSGHAGHSRSSAHQLLEIVEAIVLAIVTVATAWSGSAETDRGLGSTSRPVRLTDVESSSYLRKAELSLVIRTLCCKQKCRSLVGVGR